MDRRHSWLTPSRMMLALALFAAALGLGAALGVQRERAQAPQPPRESAPGTLVPRSHPHASTLARLGLSEGQREQVDELARRERKRIAGLRQALAATERELRSAELGQPFDAERVNLLVARSAELSAYLRGTESRVVSEVVRLLSPDQQLLFAALRGVGVSTAPRPIRRRGPEAAVLARDGGPRSREF